MRIAALALLAAACAPLEGPPPGAVSADVVVLQTRDYRVHLSHPGLYTVEDGQGRIVAVDVDRAVLLASFPELARELGGTLDASINGER